MAKTFIFTKENSEIVIGDKVIKSGESITLKDIKEIAQAKTCEYLEEQSDGDATNA